MKQSVNNFSFKKGGNYFFRIKGNIFLILHDFVLLFWSKKSMSTEDMIFKS